MSYYDDMLIKRTINLKGCCWLFIVVVLIMFFGMLFCSCRSTQYVPVETIKTEIKEVHDTFKIQDTIKSEKQIIIREADTSEIERINAEYGFKLDKAQKTILVLSKELQQQSHNQTEVKDSIVYRDKEVQVPYPVEKKLSKWEQIKMDLGEYMVVLIVIFIIGFLLFFLRRTGKRGD